MNLWEAQEWAKVEFERLKKKHPKFAKLVVLAEQHMDLQRKLSELKQSQYLQALYKSQSKIAYDCIDEYWDSLSPAQQEKITDEAERQLDHQRDNWQRVDEDQWANEQSWAQQERLNINQINGGWQ